MERAADVPGAALGVERPRDVLGVRVELDDRVERRIDALDAREVRLHERARGEVALRHRRLELGDGRLLEIELAFVIVVRRGGRGADEGGQGGDRRGSAGEAQQVAASEAVAIGVGHGAFLHPSK